MPVALDRQQLLLDEIGHHRVAHLVAVHDVRVQADAIASTRRSSDDSTSASGALTGQGSAHGECAAL